MWIGTVRATLAAAALLLAAAATGADAQTLAARVAAAPDGAVRFSFPAREGVCGRGEGATVRVRASTEWEGDCDAGPVRVRLTKSGGAVTALRMYVGGRWLAQQAAMDLGMVDAAEAAGYLLELAERAPEAVAKDAVFPATLAAEVVVWPRLLAVARDEGRPVPVRKAAIFWLGQAAQAAATEGLAAIVASPAERGVRDAAIFALSQRPAAEGVPALISVVRTSTDPRTRKTALFWLSQSNDPRAVALFEEILAGG
jgi:hypothetical protein